MKEYNKNSSNSINEILEEISKGKNDSYENAKLSSAEEMATGLVFDDMPETAKVAEEKQTKVNFVTENIEDVRPVELSVPDKFQGARYNATPEPSSAPRVATTYVPKFTEASLNYRMIDEPRKNLTSPSEREDGTIDSTKEYLEDIDPTAEIEENSVTVATAVSSSKTDDDELESASKVFKFVENEPPRNEPSPITSASADEPELSNSDTAESDNSDENTDEVAEYRIPDPVEEILSVSENTVSSTIAAKSVIEDTFIKGDSDVGSLAKVKEYTSFAQRDSLKDRFIDTIMSVSVRFFAGLILSVLVAVFEFMFASGVDIQGALRLTKVPGAMALLDFQFVLCLFLLALPETVFAIRCLIRKRVASELFLSISFVALIIYTAVIAVHSPREYALFGLIFAVFALCSIGASYFKTTADFTAFKRASKNGEKTVIDNSYTRNLEHESSALDGVVKAHKSKTVRTYRTLFVSDFYGRASMCAEDSFGILIMLGAVLGLSLVVGLIALFIPGGWVSAITAFTLVFMLACPAMSVVAHKIPYYHASREAELEKSAIIGEASLYNYAGVDVITFDDTEVFGAEDVTLQRIMLYGHSDNLTKALRQMSAIFMNVGGPLDVLFSNSLDKKCSPAQSVCVESCGISGDIDGNTVLAGTMEFMFAKGVKIPAEEGGAQEKLHNSTKVLYAAENGEVYAKFYIRYSFSEEFSMLIPIMEDADIKPLVYTRDPNITNSLISALTAGTDKIRIMKKYDTIRRGEVIYRRASAGMMTTGDKTNVINMILLAKRYRNLQSYFDVTRLISMCVGGALAAVLAIGGMYFVPSLVFAVFQGAWCGVLHFVSTISFRSPRSKKQ